MKANSIKTNIKFNKGLDNASDKLYGFVTKRNGSWRGCRESDDVKKKIVFISHECTTVILPNQLYQCTLIPMRNDGGFIVTNARKVKFPAKITIVGQNERLGVVVKFGIKTVSYYPAMAKQTGIGIQEIAEKLRKRIDLEDAHKVAEDFINNACAVKRIYEQQLGNV